MSYDFTTLRSKGLTKPVQGWVRRKTNVCFARSKFMNFNDFLIRNNALNIRLLRNLVAQSFEDHFS